jgi:hypothetical protein
MTHLIRRDADQYNPILYVHFNPDEQAYISLPGIAGAAIFNYEKGASFIRQHLTPEWKLIELDSLAPKDNEGKSTLKRESKDRSKEPKIYRKTHPKKDTSN